MKISPKQKKWIRRIGILLLLRVVIGGILYYAIVYKFKDIVQLALNVETKGAYQFDAGDVDVQLLKGKLSIKNAFIHFRDSTKRITHHDISIPDLQLTIKSFKDLIFHGHLVISNLSIIQPSLSTKSFDNHSNKNVSLHASGLVRGLQKMAKHLNIENFSLAEGSFSYAAENNNQPLLSNRINVKLSGFSKENLDKNKILGTEEMEISLKNQHWLLPDGKHEISFKSLLFSVRHQSFDIDSFKITIRREDSNLISFKADRFRMKSKDLMESLENDDFAIDSVFCIRPVLEITSDGKKKTKSLKAKDRAGGIFDEFRIGYVSITEGALQVKKGNEHPRASVKTDVQLFNLRIIPEANEQVFTDSINLALNQLEFYSKDSLFRMAVDNCTFNGNMLTFSGVSYEPTVKNKFFKGLIFHSPRIQLKDISLDHLIHRELNASRAEIYKPEISFYRGRKKKAVSDTSMGEGHHNKLLENIHNIIDVPEFMIYDGNVDINNPYKNGENITIRNIYASILLNDLIESNNRQSVKTAIPHLKTGKVKIGLPTGNITLQQYILDGTAAKNYSPEVKLSLNNGTTIIAKEVFWKNLNWDMMMDKKQINAETFSIKNINISIAPSSNGTQVKSKPKNTIPIDVKNVQIQNIFFTTGNAADKNISLNANSLAIDGLTSDDGHFSWQKISGSLSNLKIQKPGQQVATQKISFNQSGIIAHEVSFVSDNENKNQQVIVPHASISMSILTTKPDELRLENIELKQPLISIIEKKKTGIEKSAVLKLNHPVSIGKLNLQRAEISFKDLSKPDSVYVKLSADLTLSDLKIPAGYSPLISFDQLSLSGNAIGIRQHAFQSTIPLATVEISKGKIKLKKEKVAEISGQTTVAWTDASAYYRKDDSTNVQIDKISGKYDDQQFSFYAGEKLHLRKMAKHFSVTANGIAYTHRNGRVAAKEISWNRRSRQLLEMRDFSIIPKLDYEEWSAKTKWQKDYITVTGEYLQVNGLDYKHDDADSILRMQKLTLSGIHLTTAKDKRKPFMHGVEKPMPTRMIDNINLPIEVDTIEVKNSAITVTQISEKTKRKGVIPITDLNATITGISNTEKPVGKFQLKANARILNNYLRYIEYTESYNGGSDFEMKAQVSRMQLPGFSPITTPMANIAVAQGNADTLYAEWKGNQYAAYGSMNFYYSKLRVKLLNKDNPEKKTFLLNVENWLANGVVLKKNNSKSSLMYSERDKEKFVVTYWVKTLLSGVLSTAGLKKDKKYRKAYNKNKKQWDLE